MQGAAVTLRAGATERQYWSGALHEYVVQCGSQGRVQPPARCRPEAGSLAGWLAGWLVAGSLDGGASNWLRSWSRSCDRGIWVVRLAAHCAVQRRGAWRAWLAAGVHARCYPFVLTHVRRCAGELFEYPLGSYWYSCSLARLYICTCVLVL